MNEKNLQCLALDDEAHALKILFAYIERIPFLDLKLATTSVWEAMDYLKSAKVDLLFLDIQMDDLTGLQLLDIVGPSCPVILTTAYSEYALKGFDYQVTDYLLKPYSFERFLRAVTRAKASHDKNNHSPVVPTDVRSAESVGPPHNIRGITDAIFVKGDAKHKYHQIRVDSIQYIEGLKNYVRFHCVDQKVITLQNLKDVLHDLPQDKFIRVHKSFIINLDYVQQIEGNLLHIGEQSIPIGGSYRDEFFARIKK